MLVDAKCGEGSVENIRHRVIEKGKHAQPAQKLYHIDGPDLARCTKEDSPDDPPVSHLALLLLYRRHHHPLLGKTASHSNGDGKVQRGGDTGAGEDGLVKPVDPLP